MTSPSNCSSMFTSNRTGLTQAVPPQDVGAPTPHNATHNAASSAASAPCETRVVSSTSPRHPILYSTARRQGQLRPPSHPSAATPRPANAMLLSQFLHATVAALRASRSNSAAFNVSTQRLFTESDGGVISPLSSTNSLSYSDSSIDDVSNTLTPPNSPHGSLQHDA